jgi:hypothetical protein
MKGRASFEGMVRSWSVCGLRPAVRGLLSEVLVG